MNDRILSKALAVAAIATAAPLALAKSLEEVEKELAQTIAKHKTIQYKTKDMQNVKMEGYEMTSSGGSNVAYQRKGEEGYLARIETKHKTRTKMQGQPEATDDVTTLIIHDGQVIYTLSTSSQGTHATKSKINPEHSMNPYDVGSQFDNLREAYTLTLLPDDKVGGKSCYVIEAKPAKPDENPTIGRMVFHYDKNVGISVKMVSYDKAGNVMMSSETSDVKIDVDIPEDRFVFKAPDGVQVVDTSQMQQPTGTDQQAEANESEKKTSAKEEKPAEEEKAPEKEEEKAETKEKPAEKGLKGLFKKLR
jgi:outer membrane lipoprotein-sorting protein